ncbi:MAG: hypothetical protein ACQESF_07020 [Nanobdellota archaeon]
MIAFSGNKIILTNKEPDINAGSAELSSVLIERLGLMPRKKGSTEKMYNVLIELYERAKEASKRKMPNKAIMTVEEMGYFAGITRQTMYDYLKRWIELELINKVSYIDSENNVVIGYRLNGNTLEQAFEKTKTKINNHMDLTQKYIKELQRVVKNEKIKSSQHRTNEGYST